MDSGTARGIRETCHAMYDARASLLSWSLRVPVVVVTAKDITNEDRQRLNGYVEKVVQKGSYSTESLLAELRGLVTTFAGTDRT